jgi:Spy/CpxP family protein refolding chaperone
MSRELTPEQAAKLSAINKNRAERILGEELQVNQSLLTSAPTICRVEE